MKTSIVALFILILLSGCKDTPPVVSYENSPTDTSSSDNQTTPTGSTTDNSAPTVSAISPPSGATNISATNDITITFSEDMDSSTINTTNITMVDNASNSINGVVTYSSKVATFNPSSDLNWSTTYTMTVSTGVKDSASNALSSNYSWSFTTASSNSTVRPTVASVTPAGGSDNISLSTNITITFSEAMDTSTITTSNTLNGTNITLKDSSGNSIQGAITYSNNVATFNPSSNLSYSTTYTIDISTSVANSSGNYLGIPYSRSFTTVLNTPTSISAGNTHTCAVYIDNTIKCSGSNSLGNLGNGTGVLSLSPVSVTGITNAISVAAGSNHSCALLSNNTIKCWGHGSYGQLGIGSTTTQYLSQIVVSGITNAASLGIGSSVYYRSCATLNDGTIQCWGDGWLGSNDTSGSLTPRAVSNISSAKSVSNGSEVTCALLNNGSIQCWGLSSQGQLGNGTGSTGPGANYFSRIPVSVSNITNATAVSSGGGHTCAIVGNGSVKCWGTNNYGQLGDGTTNSCRAVNTGYYTCSGTPVSVSNISNATTISAGNSHACALLSDKTIKCWGRNSSGQLGDGTYTDRSNPVTVSGITSAIAVSAGSYHTCALLSDKSVKCWGNNDQGRYGSGSAVSSSTPLTTLF